MGSGFLAWIGMEGKRTGWNGMEWNGVKGREGNRNGNGNGNGIYLCILIGRGRWCISKQWK